ncbi:MAG TPA: proton-conducting transporter membrane subunit, partial [Vicinamibacterales bacterium]|nr:proton-conducting transporter membrane subunit [Vicinamibacterales bacterium]
MPSATVLAELAMLAFAAGTAGALLTRGRASRWLAAAGACTGSVATLLLGADVLISGEPVALPARIFPVSGILLRADALSAVFLVLIGLVGTAAAIYGYGYTAAPASGTGHGTPDPRRIGALLNLLLATMAVQVLADNVFAFLFAWEAMSLVTCLFVLAEADEPGAVTAAQWYLGMSHAGFAALVALLLLLSGGGLTTSFEVMRHATLTTGVRDAAFVLAVFAFGTKSGLVPLHVWLPMAHPVAPSHASALMSAVVLKMGIYGLLRLVVDLLHGGPGWWGGVLLVAGAVSAGIGILYALLESDLKRLLAFSSIENIGIIWMAIGAGLLFQANGLTVPAALAFAGALYHALNHAAFKGLLFLGAGSVLRATGTRNMERLGGLIRVMPWTAALFLVGAAAVAALPPLNGFASEWLIFQALLEGFRIPRPSTALLMPVAVGMLALASGLAAACFVKAFGITFLAIPRSAEAERALDAPVSMRAGMTILAVACVVLGLAPFLVLPLLGHALGAMGVAPGTALLPVHTIAVAGTAGTMSPPLLALALAGIAAIVLVGLRLAGARTPVRRVDAWGCGRIRQTPRMQYTAAAFAEPLRRVFAEIYRPADD